MNIKKVLAECGIDIRKCIAQTYNGASAMSGYLSGVPALLRKDVPQAIYVHCYNYSFNLFMVDFCRSVEEIHMFFSLLQQLYTFMSRSTVHPLFVKLQKNNLNKIELTSVIHL